MKNFIPDNISEHENVFDVLKERGFIEQTTDEEAVRELLGKEKIKFYIGFDPTADCLHVGHFMQVIIMMYMQKYGHTPVVLIGGGTGMVGDPSGRQDMRQMMTVETIDENCRQFKKLFDKFLDFDEEWKYEGNEGVYQPGHENKTPEPGKAIVVNNAAWLRPLNYIEFVREIGTHFNVNNMLRAECYKQRMETGLSFLEFNYMLMQGYDFAVMARDFGVKMQFGGNDQWSNMLAGKQLSRKWNEIDVEAMRAYMESTLDSQGNAKKSHDTSNMTDEEVSVDAEGWTDTTVFVKGFIKFTKAIEDFNKKYAKKGISAQFIINGIPAENWGSIPYR